MDNPVNIKRQQFVLNQVSIFAKGRNLAILDVGCGFGKLSFRLAKMAHYVVGIDKNTEVINKCNEENKYDNLAFMAMDAQVIDFNYQFDVIIFCEVLEHTKTPLEVVKNIETHLKPDGILILTIPNGYCMSEMIIGQILCGRGKSSLFYRMVRPLYGFITGTKTSQIYPFCVDSLHIQFFSLSKVGKLFKNFTIESLEHTDLGLFFVGAGRFSKLKEVECQIADHLPHNLVGGWMMVLKKR